MTHPTAQQHSTLKIFLWIAFAGLFVLALVVIFLLPSQVARDSNTPAFASSQSKASPATQQAPQTTNIINTADKPAAGKQLTEALRRLSRLESEGVRIWGKEKLKTNLTTAEEALNKANALYDKQQYTPSLAHFRDAIAAFKQLEASRKERFKSAMDKGLKAYDALDASNAVAQFKIATALEPGSDKAIKFLDRAKNLPKVLSNIEQGKTHEGAGNSEKALASYQAAVFLDPAYPLAKKLLSRIRKKIAEQNYRESISDALSLFDKQDLKGASRALKRAQKIRPNTPEVRNIYQRIANASQITALNKLRKIAIKYEKQEQWSKALDQYKKALAIDKRAAFAHRGGLRAKSFIDLYKSIDVYLADPTRLYSREPLEHAKNLYTHSGSLDGGAIVLKTKRNKLRELITSAQIPISVLLKSNQKTFVTIYRKGDFGIFDTMRVKLQPGNYTAVGSRPGYRDTMVKFQVSPAAKELTITIKSTEQIK